MAEILRKNGSFEKFQNVKGIGFHDPATKHCVVVGDVESEQLSVRLLTVCHYDISGP